VLGGVRVVATSGCLSDPHQVGDQAQPVVHDADRGAVGVLDLDGHLGQREAPPFGQVEQLHVEGEAVETGGVKEVPGGIGPEGLEAALGVVVLAQQEGVGGQVDEPPTRLTDTTGGHEGPRVGVAAAADDHVVAVLDKGHEVGDLCRRVREVGVGKGDCAPRRSCDACPDRRPLAAVDLEANDRVGSGRSGGTICVVVGAVVDDDDLEGVGRSAEAFSQLGTHPGHGLADSVDFAVGGQHHGEAVGAIGNGSLHGVFLLAAHHPEEKRAVGDGAHDRCSRDCGGLGEDVVGDCAVCVDPREHEHVHETGHCDDGCEHAG